MVRLGDYQTATCRADYCAWAAQRTAACAVAYLFNSRQLGGVCADIIHVKSSPHLSLARGGVTRT